MALRQVTPRLQWRHRDGFAPSSPALTLYPLINPPYDMTRASYDGPRKRSAHSLSICRRLLCLFPEILEAIFSGKGSHRAEIPVKGQDSGSLGAMEKIRFPSITTRLGAFQNRASSLRQFGCRLIKEDLFPAFAAPTRHLVRVDPRPPRSCRKSISAPFNFHFSSVYSAGTYCCKIGSADTNAITFKWSDARLWHS